MKAVSLPAQPLRCVISRGTDYEIGRAHAEQVGDAVRNGMPKFYGGIWSQIFPKSEPFPRRIALGTAKFAIENLIARRLVSEVPPSLRERIQGMCDASGDRAKDLMTTLIFPDLFPMLQAYVARLKPSFFVEVGRMPSFGCSSFLSSGKNFFVGRNLDFPGVGYWDRFPVIQLFQRTRGQKFIGFTTAGVPLAGITGINESQISVALHQHYATETSLSGQLPFAIAEDILANATSAREAHDMLRDSRISTAWAFVVSDGKSREGFIFESHASASGAQWLHENKGRMSHSNFFQTTPCKKAEYSASARMNWDNYYRKTRLYRLIEQAGEDLSVQDAVLALSDHFDAYWGEEKIANRTVSQLYNIQSLLLDPENMKAWVAVGDSPIHLRNYEEYDLSKIFAGKVVAPESTIPGFRFKEPRLQRAKEKYIDSFVTTFEGDFAKASRYADEALELDESAEVFLVAGVLALKGENFQKALNYFQRGSQVIEKKKGDRHLPPEYFELKLFEARALDLLGQNDGASKIRAELAQHPELEDDNLRRIAGLNKTYAKKDLRKIVMPFSSYTIFQ